MILRELLISANLSETQIFYIHKATKVVVVYKDKYFLLITFQIVMPYFKNVNNSQKLAIVGLVLNFCKNHFFRKKCYQVPLVKISLDNYLIKASFRI